MPSIRQLFESAVHFHRQGQLVQAELQYRQILQQLPNQADTLNALGVLLTQNGKAREALPLLRKATKAAKKPTHVDLNYAEALRADGQYKESIAVIKRALQMQPIYPEAQYCLGSILHDQKRYKEAITHYQKVLSAKPNFAPALNSLGVALQESGQLERAVRYLEEAIRLHNDYADAHYNLANTYLKLKNVNLATLNYRQCLQYAPDNALAHCRLAEVLMDQVTASNSEVEFHFNQAAQTISNSPHFMRAFGKFRLRQGEQASAQELLRKSIELEAEASAIFDYAHAKKFKYEEPWLIESGQRLLRSLDVNDKESEGLVWFALGKMFDDIGSYEESFSYFSTGNSIINKTKIYDRHTEEKYFSELQDFFTPSFIADNAINNANSEQLVFIVGMPRSGTTLVEQIISSHHTVFGCGELPGMMGIKTELLAKYGYEVGFPKLLAEVSKEKLNKLASKYLEEINQLFPGDYARRTDKLPHNFVHIGLIALLFPNAKIINVRRDPIDNCVSIYFQKFLESHEYAYDLSNIGHQYKLYKKLMIHWHDVLPGRIFEISYENLISDPEYWSRKLVDHVGLEWDDACLEPHKLNRSIKTASHWQVRQPIYKTSMQRWRHYEKHLGPLIEALGID